MEMMWGKRREGRMRKGGREMEGFGEKRGIERESDT